MIMWQELFLCGLVCNFVLAGSGTAKPQYTKEQAKRILTIAEEIRSLEKAEVMVDLKTTIGELETSYEMKILRSSEKRAHIDFLAPAEERGRRMLAKGNNYWSTFPDSKKVVSISRKEMIGNSAFALADIFQLDAESDYDPTIVSEEAVAGVSLLQLDLAAKHKDAPYSRIEYWVEKDGYFPIKARFFGVSGRHMKTMTVESRAEIAGRERPKVSKMVDEVMKGRISWWTTKSMKKAEIPDAVFTKDYLGKK